MKKKKWMCITGLLVVTSLLFAGCGSSSASESITYDATTQAKSSAAGYATDDIYMAEAVTEETAEGTTDFEIGSETPEVKDTSRKLIKTVDMSVETESFDVLIQTITERTESLGGYIEYNNIYNGSYYYENDSRSADLTLRIPAGELDAFLSVVAGSSNVISRNEYVEDVTLQYVDMQSRKAALETEQERLLELLEQAESVEDIITIESRLSEVRYQMESMESQLRAMDNQVSYSTVYLYIEEVARYTPVKELSTWEKISTGFAESLYNVGNGLKNFVIGLIINLPYLVVWAIVIIIGILLIKVIRKGNKKRKQRKEEKRLKKEAKKAEKLEAEEKHE